ncbi:polysaccharide biosynthesis/export family protein [Flagellimonas sp. CMM7]|uniref:polysaccharide biosynthesis/export family protein n=1 Tax=Flagellimonas sp. CMM7 TaxID=2654676 RepID=UPI0013D17AA0|nr:polysaccharide biosynthesis/export family protein [Flagellimonas sp. CMM7]UII79899.1 polysaccharide biosynthesis/export family protein [Flagellimonas sp. CMM7]
MRRNLINYFVPLFLFCFVCCTSTKEVVYFQDANEFETLVDDNSSSTKFKVDDLLSIHISTLDPEASAPFNLFRGAEEGGIRGEQVNYLVNKDGEIDFPVIGKIKVSGLSPTEARDMLREKLRDYLKNPIINIRIRNFTVTVLGAVNRPGTYRVQGEQISILEALGFAGDVNIKGRRDNIMVIRDFNGTKVYNRINLNGKDSLKSPVYYLTQNDVVYVEPNKSGKSQSSLDQRASIAISIISVVVTSAVVLLTR